MIGLSVLHADFTRNAAGVVTDNTTALEWQDTLPYMSSNWSDAIAACENLVLDGKNDWRLPNLNELLSILDDTVYNPSSDAVFQNVNLIDFYWSSTTRSHLTDSAWVIDFYNGFQFAQMKTDSYDVRCVRGGL